MGKKPPNPCHHLRPALQDISSLATSVAPRETWPEPAIPLSREVQESPAGRLNQKTVLHAQVEHPPTSIVQYPETTDALQKRLAHIFTVDPAAFYDPRLNIQYSLKKQGADADVKCWLIRDQEGNPSLCYKLRHQCCGIKVCSFNPSFPDGHTYIRKGDLPVIDPKPVSPEQESFEKTLALFVAIQIEGCAAPGLSSELNSQQDAEAESASPLGHVENSELPVKGLTSRSRASSSASSVSSAAASLGDSGTELPQSDSPSRRSSSSSSISAPSDKELVDLRSEFRSRRSKRKLGCRGQIVLREDEATGRPSLRCSEFWNKDVKNQCHFVIMNLRDVHIDYLRALLSDDKKEIAVHEEKARDSGYGPLMPCSYVADAKQQRDKCFYWHRTEDSKLIPGTMRLTASCTSRVETFIPYNLKAVPKVVVVTSGPHNHPPPRCSKTPPIYVDLFHSFLYELGWRMADATPRRLATERQFLTRLRDSLKWTLPHDPSLSHLHPSLANSDHVSHLIRKMRNVHFKAGTGWDSALHLKSYLENSLEPQFHYIRALEETVVKGKVVRMIICMFPAQSKLLQSAKWPTFDTSFKRVKGWMEFGIEAWDHATSRAISVSRAFITSESAEAHYLLFQRIAEIVKSDTGIELRFFHIHGEGIDVVTVDEHKGQALGFGRFLQHICADKNTPDPFEPHLRLSELGPYDHLKRILRICTVHYGRNIKEKVGKKVDESICAAMFSLSAIEPLKDFEGTKALIRAAGPEAKNWLDDKEIGSPFALPGIYRPSSKISTTRWSAAQSSTNGIEQMHHNLNRDGHGLTLVGGIMRGFEFDCRAITTRDVTLSFSMYPRHQPTTHISRAQASVQRNAKASQKRGHKAKSPSTSGATVASARKKIKSPASQSLERPAGTPLTTSIPSAAAEDGGTGNPIATAAPEEPSSSKPTSESTSSGRGLPRPATSPSTPSPSSLPPVFSLPPGYTIRHMYVPVLVPLAQVPPSSSGHLNPYAPPSNPYTPPPPLNPTSSGHSNHPPLLNPYTPPPPNPYTPPPPPNPHTPPPPPNPHHNPDPKQQLNRR